MWVSGNEATVTVGDRQHTRTTLQIVGSKLRGPPHERDTGIDTRRDALPTVLTDAAWMTQHRGSVLKSTMVHEATKWMGSSDLTI